MARHIGVRRAMRPSATDSISVCSIQRATLDAGVGIVTQHHDCALALVREQPRDIVCIPVGPRGAEEVGAESAPKGMPFCACHLPGIAPAGARP